MQGNQFLGDIGRILCRFWQGYHFLSVIMFTESGAMCQSETDMSSCKIDEPARIFQELFATVLRSCKLSGEIPV